ncbi:MAG: sigma-54 interaction domain-containing protein, partial [Candidatus Rokuibacteriota bacterium]
AFVPIHCGALAREVLESELFGHEKGAFTGAVATKPGLIELADGGTLFLDEIGEMEPESQVKLLRVLESHAFFRVGGTRRRTVDMRLVAATNRDLADAIKTGHFRQDLFYRINTITITLPPLRERPEDIRRLVEHFLEQNAAYGRKRLSDATVDALERYTWPGNVRELQHAVQRAVILSQGDVVQPADLPEEIRGDRAPSASPGGSLEDMERQHIIATLRSVGGHRTKAATVLGIDPKTLYRKIQAYRIAPDLYR